MAQGNQPFIFNQPQGSGRQVYDEVKNSLELGGDVTLYKIGDIIPGGGIQVDYSPTAISPIVQFLDSIRKLLPWWVWALIAFLMIYFKKSK